MVCVCCVALNQLVKQFADFRKTCYEFRRAAKVEVLHCLPKIGHYFAGNYRLSLPVGLLIVLKKSTRPNAHAQRSNGGE
jgi:hypothetical protein